ncbi:hypothetical protein L2E82_51124 [Cichorium intybus]|nr:hypothetical protein L2E82_51124 [Cichorium intybus]
MQEIVTALEDALDRQENISWDIDFIKISKLAPPLRNKSRKELVSLLFKGILLDEEKRWIWMNENKQIQEIISARRCFRFQEWQRYGENNGTSRSS